MKGLRKNANSRFYKIGEKISNSHFSFVNGSIYVGEQLIKVEKALDDLIFDSSSSIYDRELSHFLREKRGYKADLVYMELYQVNMDYENKWKTHDTQITGVRDQYGNRVGDLTTTTTYSHSKIDTSTALFGDPLVTSLCNGKTYVFANGSKWIKAGNPQALDACYATEFTNQSKDAVLKEARRIISNRMKSGHSMGNAKYIMDAILIPTLRIEFDYKGKKCSLYYDLMTGKKYEAFPYNPKLEKQCVKLSKIGNLYKTLFILVPVLAGGIAFLTNPKEGIINLLIAIVGLVIGIICVKKFDNEPDRYIEFVDYALVTETKPRFIKKCWKYVVIMVIIAFISIVALFANR